MTKTISEVKSFLDDFKIHYTEKEDENRSCILVTSQCKSGRTYTLYMVSNKDYDDLSFYVLILSKAIKRMRRSCFLALTNSITLSDTQNLYLIMITVYISNTIYCMPQIIKELVPWKCLCVVIKL